MREGWSPPCARARVPHARGSRASCARARVPPVDLNDARAFLRDHHRGVLATRRADGGIQQSPVLVNVDGDGRAIISSRETAYKVRNLRRDPWAQACVFTERFVGQWLFVE